MIAPQKIVTEVQTLSTARAKSLARKLNNMRDRSLKMQKTVVQNVKMEDLVINGLGQFDDANTHMHPLQTERFIARFRGKQPIERNRPHFLNRQKTSKKRKATTVQEADSLKMSSTGGLATPVTMNNAPLALATKTNSHVDHESFSNIIAVGKKKHAIQFSEVKAHTPGHATVEPR